jgi:hypothetical protein
MSEPVGAASEQEQAQISERERAADLQDRLGQIGMVQASGEGYAIVDYDTLGKIADRLADLAAAERERDEWKHAAGAEAELFDTAQARALAAEARAERAERTLARLTTAGASYLAARDGLREVGTSTAPFFGAERDLLAALAAVGGGHDRPESAAVEGEQQTEQPT